MHQVAVFHQQGSLLDKGPVKLIQREEIAHSLSHVMSKLFHPIIFS